MKVSRSKTQYMCVNERGDGETVLLQGVEIQKVKEFRYLESTVQCIGGCGSEVKRRVQAGRNNWTSVRSDLRQKAFCMYERESLKDGSYTCHAVYGLETVPLTKKQEAELAMAELKMLRC